MTTLTKRMAEDLTEYYTDLGIRSAICTPTSTPWSGWTSSGTCACGTFDVLVGINLLREGLDIPEVSLVAILDADKEGFLRSTRSLIQTCGRAARNVDGQVIMYADTGDGVHETGHRRDPQKKGIQEGYNAVHHIAPTTIVKSIGRSFELAARENGAGAGRVAEPEPVYEVADRLDDTIERLESEMRAPPGTWNSRRRPTSATGSGRCGKAWCSKNASPVGFGFETENRNTDTDGDTDPDEDQGPRRAGFCPMTGDPAADNPCEPPQSSMTRRRGSGKGLPR